MKVRNDSGKETSSGEKAIAFCSVRAGKVAISGAITLYESGAVFVCHFLLAALDVL